jgi:hypothetical protein
MTKSFVPQEEIPEVNRILSGEKPAQSTPGTMTRAERIASIGRAFGAKAPKKDKEDKEEGMKKGGKVKKMAGGGSASARADGIAQRGKTRGKIC